MCAYRNILCLSTFTNIYDRPRLMLADIRPTLKNIKIVSIGIYIDRYTVDIIIAIGARVVYLLINVEILKYKTNNTVKL